MAECFTCGTTETTASAYRDGHFTTRTVPVETIAERPMCRDCFYSGRGYRAIYMPLIHLAERQGVTVDVWQTGGGCQNLAVLLPSLYRTPECVTEILFGNLDGDLDTDDLRVDVSTGGDYDEEWSELLNDWYPVPEDRTWLSVADWIVRVVRNVRATERSNTWTEVSEQIGMLYPGAGSHAGCWYIALHDDWSVMVDHDNGEARIGVYSVTDGVVAEEPTEFHILDLLDYTADMITDRIDSILDSLVIVPLDDDGNCTRCGSSLRGCEC
jgi:hypothetical protein